ncbi:MAG TPA: hypothetical protein VE127_17665 [Solirubrobacteraceae bacterium]|nr:hypothetical protein [Solirubrobacteraceae bacterium]
MRLDRIAVGDIIRASIKGRVVYGEVREVAQGIVHFHPISPAAGWRHATARDITGHWRKARRQSAGGIGERDADAPAAPREQLSLPGIHG